MSVAEMAAGVVDSSYSALGLPGSNLAKSPSGSEFLGDEEAASTCPLLTPSPPAGLAYDQQLSVSSPDAEPEVTLVFEITDENGDNPDGNHELQPFGNKTLDGDEAFDATASVQSVASSSSSSSAQEPTACVQLLGPHHHYQPLTKGAEAGGQENGGTNVPLELDQFAVGGDYFFLCWNWGLIRRVSAWVILSALVGAACVALAMIITLPKVCEPDHSWWQEATVYEVFPASFQDSDKDGVGDLKGLISRVDYLQSLGITAVRLNSIFHSDHYPEGYKTPNSLTEVEPVLGTVENMRALVRSLHGSNISLIMDMPVNSVEYNSSASQDYKDPVANALQFWSSLHVDGFYLTGLDDLSGDVEERVASWREVVGHGRVLVAPAGHHTKDIDLVHVSLSPSEYLPPQINEALEKWPRVLWSLGHSGNSRLAHRMPGMNNTVGALLMLMSLPGAPSIFYGDEVGLKQMADPLGEHSDLLHLGQLAPMAWASSSKGFTAHDVLPWQSTASTLLPEERVRDARISLANMAALRARAPQFYMTYVMIAGEPAGSNFVIRYSDNSGVMVVERWFPRRHVMVTVSNIGPYKAQRDLSSLYYGGRVIVGYPSTTYGHYITFRNLILESGETLVVELDK